MEQATDSSIAWPDVVSAVGAGGTLLVAIVAAWIGLRQVAEARRLRVEQAQPYVFVAIEQTVAVVYADLVIKNVGATAAFDVRLDFSPKPESALYVDRPGGLTIDELRVFREGIPYLPPGAEVRFLFDDLRKLSDDRPKRYDVKVTYRDSHGRDCGPARYVLDLMVEAGARQLRVNTIHDVAKSLDAMKRDFSAVYRSTREFQHEVVEALGRIADSVADRGDGDGS